VILPETDREGARTFADKICAGVRALGSTTVSAGVAVAPDDGCDATALLRVADRRLYVAKNDGRDRVVDRDPDAGC